ncbi:hypothetical protein TNCT_88511 [Trichonephila clavata]|uniref:Uncharacterized protein n=1 Tax=Trichonephila clavata TaxID=2740835 RepID=A0A8X6F0H4_TRICU|nr:hypothetical protein TNCT_88511 [Trichonephila clavata]
MMYLTKKFEFNGWITVGTFIGFDSYQIYLQLTSFGCDEKMMYETTVAGTRDAVAGILLTIENIWEIPPFSKISAFPGNAVVMYALKQTIGILV